MNRIKQMLGFKEKETNPILNLFLEKKCLFFHIPKTAGISVSNALFGGVKWGHRDVVFYKSHYSEVVFDELFKFCFVRNPYERLFSAYHFLKKGGVNPIDLNFSNTHLKQYHNFDDFVLRGLNKKEIMEWVHFKPQYTFVCDKNANIVMDFIGKMENINADFNTVCKRLNLKAELKELNVNPIKKPQFSEETKAIIREKYQQDFKLFYPEL